MAEDDHLSLSERLEKMAPAMSKAQRRIAQYIKEHYEAASGDTAARVGRACQVSESTVVRFAIQLGYAGYPEFQAALREDLKRSLTLPERMNLMSFMDPAKKADFLGYVYEHDIQLLRRAKRERDGDAFEATVQALLSSERIFIAGVRSAAPLGQFLAYYLSLFLPDVRQVFPGASSEMVERLLPITAKDMLLGISFPRYSSRTVRCMAFAQSRGAKVIGLTDRRNSPLAEYSEILLTVPCDMLALADSIIPAFSLVTALIAAAADRAGERIAERVNLLEQARASYDKKDLSAKALRWEAEYES